MATQNAALTLSRAPKSGKKYFTVVEANKALAYVRPVTHDLMVCYAHVVDIRRWIEKPRELDNREHLEAEYETTMDRLSELVDELHQVGVELKDFERGLIDFPAVHQSREIYLCWQFKEESVCAWHETDAGFAGRQDIALLDDEQPCEKAA